MYTGRMKRLALLLAIIVSGLLMAVIVVKNQRQPVVVLSVSPSMKPLPSPMVVNQPNVHLDSEPTGISAEAQVVFDVATQTIVYGVNESKRLMPASTTKMMTALIALEEYDLDEIVTISRAANTIGHVIDFYPGEQLRVLDLITAMMVNSGNDAAFALADHHPNGYQAFVNLMNRRALQLGLKNTHYSDVSGVEVEDHYSSAADLAVIANIAMKNQLFRNIVATKTASISSIDGRYSHLLKNLNQLLWDVSGVIGVKTGWTENAGDCLVSYVSRDRDLIFVVLQSQDRFADSIALIDWTYNHLVPISNNP